MQKSKEYYTVTEVANLVNKSKKEIIKMLEKQKINGIKFDHRWVIPSDEVKKIIWLEIVKSVLKRIINDIKFKISQETNEYVIKGLQEAIKSIEYELEELD